ncbi:MAG TPA: DUF2117 domain-containing protein [Candidatus Methanomethylia archaeon]|nr:DUF2117 domain-containing protein [Candidatus Methanomethylicia archaeon]
MKIYVLFHGPEIFYSGVAAKLLEALGRLGSVRGVVTDTMTRTAALDEYLDDRVEVWEKTPSSCLKDMEGEADLLVIASYAKMPESGYAYAWRLVEKSRVKKPLVQVEASNGTVIPWSNGREVAEYLARELNFTLKMPTQFERTLWREGSRVYRRVLAVNPGEFLLINGFLVGRVKGDEVILVEENGRLVELIGVDVKEHGLEKLMKRYPTLNLEEAKVDTLSLLRKSKREAPVRGSRGVGVAFIDHSGYDIYHFAGRCEGAVCVGDDTTLVASDILYRFNTPVLGIVDKDCDLILEHVNVHPESELLITRHDDEAGELIFKQLFRERSFSKELSFQEVKERAAELLKRADLLIRRTPLDLKEWQLK